ncbi:MAG: hypothetical protein AAF383_14205 [Cyanobacteria bacterium P01_A01_bin.83]
MSNQISKQNQDLNQNNQNDSSFKILQILDSFIVHKYSNFKLKKNNQKSSTFLAILLKNRWLIFSFCFFPISILSLLLIGLHYSSNVQTYIVVSLIFALSIAATAYILVYYSNILYKLHKEIRSKAIDRVLLYDPKDYRKVIYELGDSFYQKELYKEEIRFEIAIIERKKRSNILKKATPLVAIFLVATGVYIFGSPENSTQIDLLYGTVAGVSGIVFVTKVVFDVYSELLDEDIKIYETCISILQKAQEIAKEEELEELDAIKAYDIAKNSGDEVIPFKAVVSDVERKHS